MAFSNNPPAPELIVPSDGSLTAGSGTIYIGGPNLPSELVGIGAVSAEVWYTNGTDANTWKYSFIAEIAGSGLVQGLVDINGNVFQAISMQANGAGPSYPPAIKFRTAGYQVDVDTPVPIAYFTGNNALTFGLKVSMGLSPGPCIKALNSGASMDSWNNLTQTGVNVNGSLNCTTQWSWYLTPDYRCEVRFSVQTAAGNFPLVNFLTVPIPGTIPLISADGTFNYVFGAAEGSFINPLTVRLDTGGGALIIWTNSLAENYIEGSVTYQVTKP